jgi:CubicO group peptidase (beta-lactamase class C family)
MKFNICCLFIFLCSSALTQIPDSTTKKIDDIFSKWNNQASPGFSIGIVRGNDLVFSRGYGMANLEYSVPNSEKTVYHMASVSKQFTAYCILLLERQGQLKLDDDIRKWLPWFPDLKEKISILHLLNHTSGIRDQWDLVVMSGIRMDDVITQEYIIRLLSRQQALNFKPGAEYSYSNSNYTLLAEIVKAVSGQSFRAFADSAIFKPLGMTSTHIHDRHTELVANRAYSYRPSGNGYENAVLSYANAGATSLFTSVSDMAKWVSNFYDTKVGDATSLKNLATKGRLNNGNEIPYAAGISVGEFNGEKFYSHTGGDAGFRTYVTVFPDKKMGFIFFGNLASLNVAARGTEVMNLFFAPKPPPEKMKIDTARSFLADTNTIAKYMGHYISEDGVRFRFYLKGSQLYWKSTAADYLLARMDKDTLASYVNPDVKFVFSTNRSNELIVDEYWPGNHRGMVKYDLPTNDTVQLDKELKPYVGSYYSPELDVHYTISIENHRLHLRGGNLRTMDDMLEYIRPNHFDAFGDRIIFRRNKHNDVESMEYNTGRVRNLVFRREGL